MQFKVKLSRWGSSGRCTHRRLRPADAGGSHGTGYALSTVAREDRSLIFIDTCFCPQCIMSTSLNPQVPLTQMPCADAHIMRILRILGLAVCNSFHMLSPLGAKPNPEPRRWPSTGTRPVVVPKSGWRLPPVTARDAP